MSTAFDFGAVRLPSRAARKFAFSLLVGLAILALCLAHAIRRFERRQRRKPRIRLRRVGGEVSPAAYGL